MPRGHKPKPNAVLKVGAARKQELDARRSQNLQPRKRRYSKKQILQALEDANGLVTAAARRLGCTRRCIVNYFKRYPDLKIALSDIRDSYVDLAEGSLLEQIKDRNTSATIFLLRCLGKDRGWVEDPKVQLHAHVEAGSGTWMEIMERVLDRERQSNSKIIDVPQPAPNRMLEKGLASGVSKEDDD